MMRVKSEAAVRGTSPVKATKLDKIKRSQQDKQIKAVRNGLGLGKDDILIPVSSETKQGVDKLWETIESFISDEHEETVPDSEI